VNWVEIWLGRPRKRQRPLLSLAVKMEEVINEQIQKT
jgi:hypothetical protein